MRLGDLKRRREGEDGWLTGWLAGCSKWDEEEQSAGQTEANAAGHQVFPDVQVLLHRVSSSSGRLTDLGAANYHHML